MDVFIGNLEYVIIEAHHINVDCQSLGNQTKISNSEFHDNIIIASTKLRLTGNRRLN